MSFMINFDHKRFLVLFGTVLMFSVCTFLSAATDDTGSPKDVFASLGKYSMKQSQWEYENKQADRARGQLEDEQRAVLACITVVDSQDNEKVSLDVFSSLKAERYPAFRVLKKIFKQHGGVEINKNNLVTILEEQLEDIEDRLTASRGVISRAAYYGLAGKHSSHLFGKMMPGSFFEGVGAALAYRTMHVVGNKFEKMLEEHGGEMFDAAAGSVFRQIKHTFLGAWYWLFNGGVRPYTVDMINQWQEEVNGVIIANLDKQAKVAQNDQGNGFATRARVQHKLDAITLDDRDENAEGQMVADPTWLLIVEGLASDLDRLTYRLELPKLHYGSRDDADEKLMLVDGRADILAYATRVQETLQLIKNHILMPTRTLKDLAAGDLKYLLPRLKEEVSQRFKMLKVAVVNYHGGSLKALMNTTESTKQSSRSDMLHDSYGQ